MDEYISRKAAIEGLSAEALERNLDSVMTDDAHRYHRAAERVIAGVPTADVRPVVRGKWGHRWICSNMSGYEYACSCSECGKPTYRMSLLEKMPNFCPNCGAEMEES